MVPERIEPTDLIMSSSRVVRDRLANYWYWVYERGIDLRYYVHGMGAFAVVGFAHSVDDLRYHEDLLSWIRSGQFWWRAPNGKPGFRNYLYKDTDPTNLLGYLAESKLTLKDGRIIQVESSAVDFPPWRRHIRV